MLYPNRPLASLKLHRIDAANGTPVGGIAFAPVALTIPVTLSAPVSADGAGRGRGRYARRRCGWQVPVMIHVFKRIRDTQKRLFSKRSTQQLHAHGEPAGGESAGTLIAGKPLCAETLALLPT